MTDLLELRGVRVHNLKGVDAAFPLGRLTVVTGVSGSGKSSLVFDTLHSEAQRRYLQSFSVSSRQLLERFDQPDADWIGDLPPAVAVRAGDGWGRSVATVADVTDLGDLLAELFSRESVASCPQCGQAVRPRSAADVVRELRALPAGMRVEIGFPDAPGEEESAEQWLSRLREDGWVRVRVGDTVHRLGDVKTIALTPTDEAIVVIDRVEIGKSTDERLLETIEAGFRRGDGRLVALSDQITMRYDRRWRCPRCGVPVAALEPRLFDFQNPDGANVRWRDRSFAEIAAMSLDDLNATLADRARPHAEREESTQPLRDQIVARLATLASLGLGSLSCGRDLATLASGEAQRLRFHRAIASGLVNALYLFEEPTAGLHPQDVERMLPHLERLRDAGNTVIVVDHHPVVWAVADHVLELGPGAGEEGGCVTYQGSLAGLRGVEGSATAHWLEPEPLGSPRSHVAGELRLSNLNQPPLRDIDVAIPLGVVCVVAGVSGAGKTRLLRDGLYPAVAHAKHVKGFDAPVGTLVGAQQIEGVTLFDQAPTVRSARGNPATSIKIFDDVRELFAETTDARIRNLGPGAFSFNQPGGRCETCEGQGRLAVDMQFLPDVTTTCPECLGRRYRKEVFAIKVRGLNIAEVLDLTAREAFRFFRAQRAIEKKLKWLLDAGLDYIRLGQPLETLSGGEMQRLKLAAHLASNRKPRSLLLLIEPTRGLHPDDVAGLLECFGQLIAAGHSLVIEDQNPFVLRQADYLVELDAGRVVAHGAPSEMARYDTPTGRFLSNARIRP